MRYLREHLNESFETSLKNMLMNYKHDIIAKPVVVRKIASEFGEEHDEINKFLDTLSIRSTPNKDIGKLAKTIIKKYK